MINRKPVNFRLELLYQVQQHRYDYVIKQCTVDYITNQHTVGKCFIIKQSMKGLVMSQTSIL